jgi:G3E family GTPase
MSLFDRDRSGERAPVSVITGFLGSGKTTLLNRLLRHAAMARSLVVVNEFGEIGLDQHFIESRDSDLVLLRSGCICCTVRGDLERTLRDIAARRQRGAIPPFERVLIETTGLADPAPIAGLLLNHPFVTHDFRLDAIVATLDAANAVRQLEEHAESVAQVAIADRLVLTKTDLVDAATSASVRQRARALNPAAPILAAVAGAIAPEALFGAGPFDPVRGKPRARLWLASEAYADSAHDRGCRDPRCAHPAHATEADGESRHDARIRTLCLIEEAPLDWLVFRRWLDAVRAQWGDSLLRVKGILAVDGEAGPLVVHGVHRTFHPPVALEDWPDDDRHSRLVFILRGLAPETLRESWRAARDEARVDPPSSGRESTG